MSSKTQPRQNKTKEDITKKNTDRAHPHPCHKDEIKRLNRISGQVDGIKRMIEQGRYCPEILTQLRAVKSAIKSIEANILETHLSSCVSEALAKGTQEESLQKIQELKDLFKRFDD